MIYFSYIILVLWSALSILFTFESIVLLMCRGCHWCGIFHYHWWTTSIKQRLLFSPCKLSFLRNFPFSQIMSVCALMSRAMAWQVEFVFCSLFLWLDGFGLISDVQVYNSIGLVYVLMSRSMTWYVEFVFCSLFLWLEGFCLFSDVQVHNIMGMKCVVASHKCQ